MALMENISRRSRFLGRGHSRAAAPQRRNALARRRWVTETCGTAGQPCLPSSAKTEPQKLKADAETILHAQASPKPCSPSAQTTLSNRELTQVAFSAAEWPQTVCFALLHRTGQSCDEMSSMARELWYRWRPEPPGLVGCCTESTSWSSSTALKACCGG